MSRTRLTIVALALVAFAGACSDDATVPLPRPSSQFPPETPTASTGTTGASGVTSVLPTTSPAAGTGNLVRGEVTFRIEGDVRADRRLGRLITAVFTPPPGGLAIVWTAGGADASTVGIGGPSFVGARPTSPSLTLTLIAQSEDGIWSFSSTDGECRITIDVATEGALSGGFTCSDLIGSRGEVVDVTASFEASG